MTVVGAAAAGIAFAFAVLSLRASSPVARRLHAVGERQTSRVSRAMDPLAIAKIVAALAGGLTGIVIAWLLPLGILPVVIGAYVGFIGPSLVADRARSRRRRDAEQGVVTLVEWLHALVASGRPLESALTTAASRVTGDDALDASLERVRRDYTLGVPMHQALEREGQAAGIAGLVELAMRLERARDLGRGVLPLLQDLRDDLRAAERARGLNAASQVEGKLTLVLTLCYMPALALLVIVPLFLTLLAGLFA
jgi:Flp pilus assembly protein TadB